MLPFCLNGDFMVILTIDFGVRYKYRVLTAIGVPLLSSIRPDISVVFAVVSGICLSSSATLIVMIFSEL